MVEQIFNEEMSNEEIFLAYRLATEKGLFESADFFLQDDDYHFLLKKIIIDYGISGQGVLKNKYMRRLWGIYIRELVYRYAKNFKEIWPSLQNGLESDITYILEKYPNEKSAIKQGESKFSRNNNNPNQPCFQYFCYDTFNGNGGNALKNIFGSATFDNPEYWIPSSKQYYSGRRYFRFLLKLAILPSDYFPERDDGLIYNRLKNAYIECNPVYFSSKPVSNYKNRIKEILKNRDGWNVHPNTIGAFAKRLEEFFSYVFSWKKCGYTLNDAYLALEGTFPFLNIHGRRNYLFNFLEEEYRTGFSNENVKNRTTNSQNQIKRHFQFSFVLDKRSNQLYFKRPEGNLKYHLSTYLSNKELIGADTIIQINDKENGEMLATINFNGAIQFPNCQPGDKKAYNQAVLRLAKDESITIAWNNIHITEKNPWYKPDVRYLLNQFGTYADSWNVGKEAYLAYPENFGKLIFNQEWMHQNGQIEYLDFISSNSGMNIYKFNSDSQLEASKIRLSTENGKKIEIELRDLEQIRTIKNFEGSPIFVEQNLHSKIAIGQIQFSFDDSNDGYEKEYGEISYSISNNVLTLRNKSSEIVILEDDSPIISELTEMIGDKKFPHIVLLPENSMIWISNEDNVKMCHWYIADGVKKGDFNIDDNNCVEITNGFIQPANSCDSPNKFQLIYPTWNGKLGNDNCVSKELGTNTVWLEPDFPEANVYLNWRENDIEFSVSISPDERQSNKCFESLSEIYRAFKVNGAQLTAGWDYRGKKFIKTFNQSDNYNPPLRNTIYHSEELYEPSSRGTYLKNYLINKQNIEERCSEYNKILEQNGVNYTFYSEQFDSTKRLKNFVQVDNPALCYFIALNKDKRLIVSLKSHQVHTLGQCRDEMQRFMLVQLGENDQRSSICNEKSPLEWNGLAALRITYPKIWGKILNSENVDISLIDDRWCFVYKFTKLQSFPPNGEICLETKENHTIKISIKKQQVENIGKKNILPGDFCNVFVGNVEYKTANSDKSLYTLYNKTNSIIEYPAKCECTSEGFIDFPRTILLPNDVKMCVIWCEGFCYAFISGCVDNLSNKWKYDEKLDISYICIEGDDAVPLTEEINLTAGIKYAANNEPVKFYDTSYLIKPTYVWFKYNNDSTYETSESHILSKGLPVILYHLPINKKKFEFAYKSNALFYYNKYTEILSKHFAYKNASAIHDALHNFSNINFNDLKAWQKCFGFKSINLQLEFISLLAQNELNFKYRTDREYIFEQLFNILAKANGILESTERFAINNQRYALLHNPNIGNDVIPNYYKDLDEADKKTGLKGNEFKENLIKYKNLQVAEYEPKPEGDGARFFFVNNLEDSESIKHFLLLYSFLGRHASERRQKNNLKKILQEYHVPTERLNQEPYLFKAEYIQFSLQQMKSTILPQIWEDYLSDNDVPKQLHHEEPYCFKNEYINYNGEQLLKLLKEIVKPNSAQKKWNTLLTENGILEDQRQTEEFQFKPEYINYNEIQLTNIINKKMNLSNHQKIWSDILTEIGVTKEQISNGSFQFKEEYTSFNREQKKSAAVKIQSSICTTDDKRQIWRNLLLEGGIPEADLENRNYAFKAGHKFYTKQQLENEAKKLIEKYQKSHS